MHNGSDNVQDCAGELSGKHRSWIGTGRVRASLCLHLLLPTEDDVRNRDLHTMPICIRLFNQVLVDEEGALATRWKSCSVAPVILPSCTKMSHCGTLPDDVGNVAILTWAFWTHSIWHWPSFETQCGSCHRMCKDVGQRCSKRRSIKHLLQTTIVRVTSVSAAPAQWDAQPCSCRSRCSLDMSRTSCSHCCKERSRMGMVRPPNKTSKAVVMVASMRRRSRHRVVATPCCHNLTGVLILACQRELHWILSEVVASWMRYHTILAKKWNMATHGSKSCVLRKKRMIALLDAKDEPAQVRVLIKDLSAAICFMVGRITGPL